MSVNGTALTEPGYDVRKGDEVRVNGELIDGVSEKKVYYAMNKPTGCITSVSDDRGRLTVMDFLPDTGERLFPVGRLDYNTSGLLFITNDGEFAYRLTHPKHQVNKTYMVRINGAISKAALAKLRHGVDIGHFVTSPARVDIVTWTKHSTILRVTIHEGKNRQVRRMFEAVGKHVQELERVAIANVELGHLKPGTFRKLNPSEVAYLMGL